ncbi:MAG TPA: hypothetical protein VL201_03735 [Patescibacteria group bacterium]|nr:hypothetical protein [Patescibacteria group bacterium]
MKRLVLKLNLLLIAMMFVSPINIKAIAWERLIWNKGWTKGFNAGLGFGSTLGVLTTVIANRVLNLWSTWSDLKSQEIFNKDSTTGSFNNKASYEIDSIFNNKTSYEMETGRRPEYDRALLDCAKNQTGDALPTRKNFENCEKILEKMDIKKVTE